MKDFALYIHFPFCMRKCNYCDFYSITEHGWIDAYLKALHKEIDQYQKGPPFGGFSVTSIYLGGGTPSLLPPNEITKLLKAIKKGFYCDECIEITLEANPGAIEYYSLQELLLAGVNRLSLGIQSFSDKELRTLTRIHTAQEAESIITESRRAGFDNINVDLIFGIPGQDFKSWEYSLKKTVALLPEHVSMYGLTYESGTALTNAMEVGKLKNCDEELEREMYFLGKDTLEAAGYAHYEISNLALPGCRSIHNQSYWDGSCYLGLGPGGHSFDGDRRWWNRSDVSTYVDLISENQSPVVDIETLTKQQKAMERILLGFRRREGIRLEQWRKRFHCDLLRSAGRPISALGGYDTGARSFESSKEKKVLILNDTALALSREGLVLYDFICRELSGDLKI